MMTGLIFDLECKLVLFVCAVVPQTPTISSSPSGDITDASSFTLTCATASTGLSTETYVWSIAGVDQAPQSGSTLAQTADINNVAAYTCKVSGDGGTDYSAVSSTHTPSGKWLYVCFTDVAESLCICSRGLPFSLQRVWEKR